MTLEGWLQPALRPLVHFADFRGRSTRTELIAFYMLYLFAGILISYALLFVDFRASKVGADIFTLAMLCPFLALFVRRLHDQGRSGWWLLLLLPAGAWGAWKVYQSEPWDFSIILNERPLAVEIAVSLCGLALLVLLAWKDDEGANRYGSNPRYDDPPTEPA